ncbi:MAG: Sll0314/Alr1548 family TPR repeat-containing protein [Leptolyngbyaceae cyanobacterium bins.349]|nr:Sll0314/Alr1548 family TPR repeat-containing protein [Leptolyngbyaceae cyanobacterium bins.349]
MPKIAPSFTLQTVARLTSAAIVAMGLWAGSVLAKDPFRTTNPRPINENTQAAFEAFFKKGDYKSAANYLKQLDPNDPLSLAMKASLTYSDMLGERDAGKKTTLLEEFQSYANQTRGAAERLLGNDPLRGNLYLAVSHFFDGVYAFTKEGTVKGTAKVLGELQQIIKYLNEAEAKSPNDPELNLLRGYIDVYSGIYLPFSSPDKGIERLQKFANPRYLADRGLAMGYLEMNQYDKAMAAVDGAIAGAPDNPELWYLKSRILAKQGKDQESIAYLERAIAKKDQLPFGLVREMERALRKTRERIGQAGR